VAGRASLLSDVHAPASRKKKTIHLIDASGVKGYGLWAMGYGLWAGSWELGAGSQELGVKP
jgi:hypothetical protein